MTDGICAYPGPPPDPHPARHAALTFHEQARSAGTGGRRATDPPHRASRGWCGTRARRPCRGHGDLSHRARGRVPQARAGCRRSARRTIAGAGNHDAYVGPAPRARGPLGLHARRRHDARPRFLRDAAYTACAIGVSRGRDRALHGDRPARGRADRAARRAAAPPSGFPASCRSIIRPPPRSGRQAAHRRGGAARRFAPRRRAALTATTTCRRSTGSRPARPDPALACRPPRDGGRGSSRGAGRVQPIASTAAPLRRCEAATRGSHRCRRYRRAEAAELTIAG